MSGFKGTKGKWCLAKAEMKDNKIIELVVTSENKIKLDNGLRIIASLGYFNSADEIDEANALLISKAPEMLEMLDKLKDHFGLFPENRIAIKQLIKQATEL